MTAVVADTHAVLWSLFSPQRLSPTAANTLNETLAGGDVIYVASISVVEVAYLVEKGRIPAHAFEQMLEELARVDSGLQVTPLDLAISRHVLQIPRDSIPDMPDRIVAATALFLGLPLVTRDHRIRASDLTTIW